MLEELAFTLGGDLGVARSHSDLEDLLRIAASVGLDSEDLQDDLERLLRQRIVLWCAGGIVRDMNFRERERLVVARLRALTGRPKTWTPSPFVVRELATLGAQLGNAGVGPRETMSTIDATTRRNLLNEQGNRCAVCGVPLSAGVVRDCPRFESGREPVFTPTLEHIVPFSLVGNKTAFEVLCAPCNSMKRDRLGWQEDGRVVAGNLPLASVQPGLMRRMIFWTLYRRRCCSVADCDNSASTGVLMVDSVTSPATFGALRVLCVDHSEVKSIWIHSGLMNADDSWDDE